MSVVVGLLALVVAILALVVAGLLRTNADVLRALERLGEGVGEDQPASRGVGSQRPPAPHARTGRPAADVAGATIDGGAQTVRVVGTDHDTLLLFLSSGCLTCQSFWEALREPGGLGLPARVRVVVVAKGPEAESPSELAERIPTRGATTVLSTEAWQDLEVPGSPYAVLVDGPSGRVIGEGTGPSWPQVARMLAQATGDLLWVGEDQPRTPKARRDMATERDTDAELLAAGIEPGDPSLYPGAAQRSDDDGRPE